MVVADVWLIEPIAPKFSPAYREKKRRDYTFRHEFNEKPGHIPGCPKLHMDIAYSCAASAAFNHEQLQTTSQVADPDKATLLYMWLTVLLQNTSKTII